MTITTKNEELICSELKAFYIRKIKESANKYGFRKLSSLLKHDENFINVVIRRDAFSAIKRLYNEIKLAGYIIE